MTRVTGTLFFNALLSVLLLSSLMVVDAAVSEVLQPRQESSCSRIRVRKEWRDMTVEQRLAYIQAVKCLQSTPSSSTRAGVVTRFDEFQAAHIDLTPQIHQVGQFLPWHRHYLTLYDKALREECGYNGPAAFWDWSRDADNLLSPMSDSPVFDSTTGFGGNGVPGTYNPPTPQPRPAWVGLPPGLGATGCVQTGPFKDLVVNLGPGNVVGAHCLVRGFNEILKPSLTSAAVNALYLLPQFETFRQQLENGVLSLSVHNGGHGIVGGEMLNVYSSPGDPLFYLHHGNLDRIWWKWQNASPSTRMYAVSGNTDSSNPALSPQLTLNYQMPFTTLSTPVRVEDVMDTTNGSWCFTYDY